MSLTLGIDEAGRGPLIGPLVMASVALTKNQAISLRRAGVDDSKKWTGEDAHVERSELAARIRATATHWQVVVIDVATVDEWTAQGGLNRLEQQHAARMISAAPAAKRIVCDGKKLFAPLRVRFPHLDALDGADGEHASVAAASILAKTRRDEIWHLISRRYALEFGDLCRRGGGYVNAATRAFVRAYVERHGRMPPEVRRSWPWDFVADLISQPAVPTAQQTLF